MHPRGAADPGSKGGRAAQTARSTKQEATPGARKPSMPAAPGALRGGGAVVLTSPHGARDRGFESRPRVAVSAAGRNGPVLDNIEVVAGSSPARSIACSGSSVGRALPVREPHDRSSPRLPRPPGAGTKPESSEGRRDVVSEGSRRPSRAPAGP